MANPFAAQGLLQPQAWRGRSASPGGFGMAIANRNAAQARQAEMQSEFQDVLASNDPKRVAEFSFKYPEAAKQAQQSFGIANQQTRGLSSAGYGKALQSGDPAQASEILTMYANEVEAAGGNPVNMRQDAAGLISGDLDMNKLEMGVAITEPELWDRFNKVREAQQSGRPEAMTEYQAAMVAGNEANRELRRLEIKEKNIDRQIKRETNELKRQELQRELDESLAKKEQVKLEDYTRIDNAITDAENKKDTIKELLGNKGYIDSLTGYQGRLPSTTDEGIEAEAILDNIKNSMTIENLSVMSGPLTDKDIQVIASASSRLNAGMGEKAFKKELERISGAYDRVIDNYKKEITRKGYEKNISDKKTNDNADVNAQALEWARANPNDPRSRQILSRLGVN